PGEGGASRRPPSGRPVRGRRGDEMDRGRTDRYAAHAWDRVRALRSHRGVSRRRDRDLRGGPDGQALRDRSDPSQLGDRKGDRAGRPGLGLVGGGRAQTARVTLPAFRHLAHTFSRRGAPFTRARTRWMFGSNLRFDRRWECDTFIPKPGVFPHTSQTAAIAWAW